MHDSGSVANEGMLHMQKGPEIGDFVPLSGHFLVEHEKDHWTFQKEWFGLCIVSLLFAYTLCSWRSFMTDIALLHNFSGCFIELHEAPAL